MSRAALLTAKLAWEPNACLHAATLLLLHLAPHMHMLLPPILCHARSTVVMEGQAAQQRIQPMVRHLHLWRASVLQRMLIATALLGASSNPAAYQCPVVTSNAQTVHKLILMRREFEWLRTNPDDVQQSTLKMVLNSLPADDLEHTYARRLISLVGWDRCHFLVLSMPEIQSGLPWVARCS